MFLKRLLVSIWTIKLKARWRIVADSNADCFRAMLDLRFTVFEVCEDVPTRPASLLFYIFWRMHFNVSLLSWISMASTPPHNFSWVEPGKLAGLAQPRMTSEYQYLLDNGIKHLVCLCERKPPYHDTCPELQLHHIKIVDFTPPSPSQIERFLNIVEVANSKGEVGHWLLKRVNLMEAYSYL